MKHILITLSFSFLVLMVNAQDEFMKFTIDSAEYEVEIDPSLKASMMIGGGATTLVSGSDGKTMSVSCMFPGADTAKFELTGSYAAPMVTISMSAKTIYLIEEGTLVISEYTDDKWVTGKFYGTAKLTSIESDKVYVTGKFKLQIQ